MAVARTDNSAAGASSTTVSPDLVGRGSRPQAGSLNQESQRRFLLMLEGNAAAGSPTPETPQLNLWEEDQVTADSIISSGDVILRGLLAGMASSLPGSNVQMSPPHSQLGLENKNESGRTSSATIEMVGAMVDQ
ncbi:MAG: hypothetical protein WCK65_06550, partial [Rhodospirillaceae bacterium]